MITQLVSASVTPDQPLPTGGSLAFGQKQPFGIACSISQTGAVKLKTFMRTIATLKRKLMSLLQDINKVVSLADFFFGPSSSSGFDFFSQASQLPRRLKKGR